MVNITITKSNKRFKKYDAIISDHHLVSFGDNRYQDYTMHKDTLRKDHYINRHKKNENWNDYTTPGFYSRWILWNLPSLEESVRDTMIRFPHLKITLRI